MTAKKSARTRSDSRLSQSKVKTALNKLDKKPPSATGPRLDTGSWGNILTGLGVRGIDRAMSARFQASSFMGYGQLTQLYLSEPMGKRIVDLIPDEQTRQWFTIPADTDNAVLAKLDELNARVEMTNLLKWSRLYGGCIAVLGIDDGGELYEPVNEDAIRDIKFIHLFDRFNVWWTTSDIYSNINNPKYGTPEIFHVTPYHGGVQFAVHESRCLRMQGEVMPERLMIMNQGWGTSVFQTLHNVIRDEAISYQAAGNIVQDFIQTTIKIQNLSDMIRAGQSAIVNQRMQLIDTSRSVANTIILDALEDYSKSASSVAGLADLLDRFSLKLSSATGIPYTLLMGQGVKGLNATGDADIRLFYDKIKAEQIRILKPALHRLCRLIMLSKNGPLKGKEPEGWDIQFNPLWQMSETETAAYRYQVAQTDQIYLTTGVLDPSEVAKSRFGGNVFSPETMIDMENRHITDMTDEEKQQFDDFKKQSETGIVTTGTGSNEVNAGARSIKQELEHPASEPMM